MARSFLEMAACFARDDRGATMVEYALLLAMIAVALIATFQLLQVDMAAIYDSVSTTLKANTAK